MIVIPSSKEWQTLCLDPGAEMFHSTAQLHLAAQFIAMMGKYFVENEPDDSHTNMGWLPEQKYLVGHQVKGDKPFSLALDVTKLQLHFLNNDKFATDSFSLNGRTKSDVVEWIKSQLKKKGYDDGKFNMDLHYDIPAHETDNGEPFKMLYPAYFEEFARNRTNFLLILEHFTSRYKDASPTRTWPHHFDIGNYIPIEFEDGEVTKSFNIGLAVSDKAVDEPYFYVTTWAANVGISTEDLPKLYGGGEWFNDGYAMAVLRASTIRKYDTLAEQLMNTQSFFESAIFCWVNDVLGVEEEAD